MTTDLLSGGLAASFQQRFGSLSTEGSTLGSIASRLSQPDANTQTQTQQAVQAPEDSVAVNDRAERAADLQSILAELTENPTDVEAVSSALRSLQDFAATETSSQFGGSVVGQLAEIADTVLGAIEADPAALEQSFAFSFSVNFTESLSETENFYSESQSLEVSFSINTATTAFSGDFSFNESTEASAEGISYQSQESVSLRLVSFDNDPASNPLINQFAELTQELTGFDISEALGLEEDTSGTALLAGQQVDIREVPLFKEFFERLNSLASISEQTSLLLNNLRDRLGEAEDDTVVAA